MRHEPGGYGSRWLVCLAVLLALSATLMGAAPAGTGFLEDELVIESSGQSHRFRVEIAQTPGQWERGLMFRDHLGVDRGMLFVLRGVRPVRMWMKNTLIPLDMLFLDPDGVILRIARNTVPLSTEVIDSGGPVKGVLEINSGLSEKLGLHEGDRVLHPFFRSAGNR